MAGSNLPFLRLDFNHEIGHCPVRTRVAQSSVARCSRAGVESPQNRDWFQSKGQLPLHHAELRERKTEGICGQFHSSPAGGDPICSWGWKSPVMGSKEPFLC